MALWILGIREALTASELAAELQVPRTSARRILDTLASEGYVEKDRQDFSYRLVPVMDVSAAGNCDDDWVLQIATPLLARAAEAIGWPLSLATLVRQQLRVRAAAGSRYSDPHLTHAVGVSAPILRRAGGYVLLAFMAPQRRELMLRMLQASCGTERSSIDEFRRVRAMLSTVESQRFAQIFDETGSGASVAVPILYAGVGNACIEMCYERSEIDPPLVSTAIVPGLQALAARDEWRPHAWATLRTGRNSRSSSTADLAI